MNSMNETQHLRAQYRDASNLRRRIALHDLYSVNPVRWQPWIFDQIVFAPGMRLLELGCGPGTLWRSNDGRLPPGVSFTLSDFSPGMAATARCNLADLGGFVFTVADAVALPFASGRFDIVVANHMLYHASDLSRALHEIGRVLRPGGTLYATTNGAAHLVELDELREGLIPHQPIREATASFMLENGRSALEKIFSSVELRLHEDELRVTDVEPLVEYERSRAFIASENRPVPPETLEAYAERAAAALEEAGGVLHVSKESGLFIAHKSRAR